LAQFAQLGSPDDTDDAVCELWYYFFGYFRVNRVSDAAVIVTMIGIIPAVGGRELKALPTGITVALAKLDNIDVRFFIPVFFAID